MGKFKNWLAVQRERREMRAMDRFNLREANMMGGENLEDDAWLYDLVWDKKRGKYRRSKTAFAEGLKKFEQSCKNDNADD
jgi:hypothetical protein